MNSRFFGILAALGAAAFAACAEDPTATLRGGPSSISINPNPLFLTQGGADTIEVVVRDDQLNGLAVPLTVTGGSAAITVTPETTTPDPTGVLRRYVVTGVSPAGTTVNASAGGVNRSGTVVVLPTTFGGAVSSTTPAGGDTITITSTATLQFNPATANVTFAGGAAATILSATTNAVTMLVPFSSGGPVTIDGVAVTYVPGLVVSLPSSFSITQTGDQWSGDDAIGTAPAMPVPGSGETAHMITNVTSVNNSASCPEVVLNFGSSGPCMIYAFTLAQDTELDFLVDWDSDADVDIYVCPDADPNNCYEDGGSGATGAQPEATGAVFTAGTHYFFIEVYSGTNPKNIYVTISQP